MTAPEPIQPDGVLDGLHWSPIMRGALLDIVLTIFVSLPLMVIFAGEGVLSEDTEIAERALQETLAQPGFLAASFAAGLVITIYAAFWAAKRAGEHPLRHGGWTAVVSMVLGGLFTLAPGAQEGASTPLLYDAVAMALMLPAGVLGGWLAGRVAPRDPGAVA